MSCKLEKNRATCECLLFKRTFMWKEICAIIMLSLGVWVVIYHWITFFIGCSISKHYFCCSPKPGQEWTGQKRNGIMFVSCTSLCLQPYAFFMYFAPFSRKRKCQAVGEISCWKHFFSALTFSSQDILLACSYCYDWECRLMGKTLFYLGWSWKTLPVKSIRYPANR